MIELLRKNNRLNEAIFLMISGIICFAFSMYRISYTDSNMFLFLNWNLFLAFIPWALTSYVVLKPKIQAKKGTVFLLLFAWLIFFPNAPYILTDLFHLKWSSDMPMWFDLILILLFAWSGLMFGLLSLWDIEKMIGDKLSRFWTSTIVTSLLFIGGFGIYLGRFLRWNSWDVVNNPSNLMYDIGDRVIHPFDHPRTWGVTLFMGLFLNMVYWSFKLLRKREA